MQAHGRTHRLCGSGDGAMASVGSARGNRARTARVVGRRRGRPCVSTGTPACSLGTASTEEGCLSAKHSRMCGCRLLSWQRPWTREQEERQRETDRVTETERRAGKTSAATSGRAGRPDRAAATPATTHHSSVGERGLRVHRQLTPAGSRLLSRCFLPKTGSPHCHRDGRSSHLHSSSAGGPVQSAAALPPSLISTLCRRRSLHSRGHSRSFRHRPVRRRCTAYLSLFLLRTP